MPTRLRKKGDHEYSNFYESNLEDLPSLAKWPGPQPELITDSCRLIAIPRTRNLLLCSKGFAVRKLQPSGFTGLADIGDQELDAARSKPLSWDVDAHCRIWQEKLRPLVLSALNNLSSEGDIPARYGFLVHLANEYGLEILTETTLPWLTVRDAPGNSILVTSAEFQLRAGSANEVAVVYNGDLWTAETDSRRMFPNCAARILVVSVSTDSQPEPPNRFFSRDTIVEGTLEEHFRDEDFGRQGDPTSATLLQATLLCLARAWGTELSKLNGTWKKKRDVIIGRFLRTENEPSEG